MTMGKSLVRAKERRKAANRAAYQAILDQHHRIKMAELTAPKLQSIWQTNDFQDVLAAADAKTDGYMAERGVRVVVGDAVHVVAGEKLVPQLDDDTQDWNGMSAKLDIPQRPRWNYTTSAGELEENEKQMFLEWRRTLAGREEENGVLMTPYEKNLEVWRQLWRVVERSDIVLQIVDARNPLAFRCSGFERYVSKHKSKSGNAKRSVLLLNKADLLTDAQRQHWAHYFTSLGIEFCFFSARQSIEEQDARAAEVLARAAAAAEAGDHELAEAELAGADPSLIAALSRAKVNASTCHSDPKSLLVAAGVAPPPPQKKARRRNDGKLRGAPVMVSNPYAVLSRKAEAVARVEERERQRLAPVAPTEEEVARDERLRKAEFAPDAVLSPVDLLDRMAHLRQELGVSDDDAVMIGMIGFPNVGKSSTINALLRSKRVVVSSTPGKTKHFQTLGIPEERRIKLCDCPGLVFPTFSATRESMVCDGILPVDTVRDYTTAVGLVVRRVPGGVLERLYNIDCSAEGDIDESASPAERVLNALARRRGYMTDHDKPYRGRAALELLKDFVDGKIVFVAPPPGLQMSAGDVAPEHAVRLLPGGAEALLSATGAGQGSAEPEAEAESKAEDGDWEDVSSASEARGLSDDEASDSDEEDEPGRLTFYDRGEHGPQTAKEREAAIQRAPTTAELFNAGNNAEATIPAEKQRVGRKKRNAQLQPDDEMAVEQAAVVGEGGLFIDEDDDIVAIAATTGVEPKQAEKKKSKRAQRRDAKRAGVQLRPGEI